MTQAGIVARADRRVAPSAGPWGAGAPASDGLRPQRAAGDGWPALRRCAGVTGLLLGEAMAFGAALWVTRLVEWRAETPLLIAAALAVIALRWMDGLYPGWQLLPHERFRRTALSSLKVALGAWLMVAVPSGSWTVAAAVAWFLAAALLLAPLGRALVVQGLSRLGLWGEWAVAIGGDAEAALVRRFFDDNRDLGIRCVDPEADLAASPVRIGLLVGPSPASRDLAALHSRFPDVYVLGSLPGLHASDLQAIDLHGQIGARLRCPQVERRLKILARSMDIAIAAAALTAAAPLILAACAAIYLIDPGPVLYLQTREGRHGRSFRIFKLRTMYTDAESRLEALLRQDEIARLEWTRHFKLREDPRILPVVGRFLRSTSIDELPQLVNIMLGDMRVVGPRPFPAYHLEEMGEFREKRGSVVPGLTGLWQVTDRSTADLARQKDLDSFYIDHRSFWLDLHIVTRTLSALFRRKGAY